FLRVKMSKKRRGEDSSEPNTPVKKEKVPEFNGTVFKAMLKEPTTAMKALGAFISTAKKLPCSDLYDVVEGYIKISMECAEIFKLLEGEKHLESEMMLIFESLEMILLRTASDLSHFNMVGNAIVKKMVSSHMKLLQGSFHSQNHRFVRQCISLLSALVSQGPEAAREVLSHIHINKALSGLVKRKDKRVPDVRMTFIQFVLSFLVSGDNATVGQILESKELLPEILSTGVKEDRLSIVSLILSTLKTRVVLNKAISKTQKVRFFTPAVLANIASLYKWNGTVDENSEHAGISVVRELVHSFLIDLCCSRKHGISFHDASFGTAGRAGNIVLLQFLVGLKQATDDELVADLVVNVLKASPDILARYFKETQYSYTPRLKSAWQDNVKLLRRIYEAQPEFSTIFRTLEVIPLPRLLSVITVTSVPPVCNKAFFTQGLNLANTAVQFTTFSMMNFILKRANKNIEYLLDKSVWHNSDVYTHDMMEELVQQYRETLSKILPDMMSIVSTWQLLSRKDKGSGQENKTKAERAADQADNKKDMPAEVILLKALILQVICLYQKVVPHLVNQCKFDFSKLLKSIMSEKGIREEVPPVLQYHILQLALDLPASKFSWFRIQDVADTESLSGEKSVLYLLLMMFVSTSSTHLKTSTQMLILKVLKDTGVFEYTWTELELWLNQLARIEPNQQETVIQFLERVLVKLLCSSYTYTDKVASLVQDAAFLQANLNSQEGDAASIPVSHIDDVLDMLDVIMEGNNGEMEEFGPSLSEDLIIQTFPFSVLVPAALEARNKLSNHLFGAEHVLSCQAVSFVYEYLSAVLSDVLHCQREPLPLCLALMQYDKELVSSEHSASPHPSIIHFHQYYSKWLPQQCQDEPVSFWFNYFRHTVQECVFSISSFNIFSQTSAEDITASEWNGFVKNGLKYRYRDHHFLHTLRGLLDLMYSGGEVQKDLIPLSTLHMMSSSHSLFLPTMLEPDEEPSRFQAKEGLVSLLLCLVKKCPTVCNIDHFVVLLGAYGATLNTTDQKLLQLLQEYERNHVSLLKFHAVVITLSHHCRLYSAYICAFLILFLTECVIDCLKFVSSHALGVTVMALSSYDPQVRAAAYHVLSCFYQHLEGARFREKRQLLYLMDTVKNGIRKQNQRLPFVLTTYITKVAQQMLKPEDHMYVVLNRFLLSHQSLDFRRVPEFFKLFYGFDLEHKVEREWILSVLEEGINDGHCYELCDQQGIFQILLGFSSSPLCDEHSQAQIIRVLCQAARVPKAANNLTKSCGVLTWIIQAVLIPLIRNLDQQLLSAIIDLLHVLWFTNLGQKEKHQGNGAKTTSSTEEKPQSSVKCLPLPLINEFLCVALTISRHLRLGLKPSQLRLFLQSFCSALKHRETALNENKQAGRFTLHPQPLSCTEALSLLLCWASMSHNTALLTHIQALSEKHKVAKAMKDKARSKGSFFQARTQKETLAEDTEDAKQEERLLAECKFYLRSIFIHWEPVFHVSESQSVQSRDKLDPSQLACDTAHLLTKWSLRCLVEDSYDVNRTKEFMHWVEKAVIKHKEIVDVVLLDPCVKADLLQLYHQAFEAQCQPSISSRVETLQQFTNIMISLLETKSHLPELHQTVISACLPKATHDPSKSGKSLPLYLQTLAYSSHKRQKESLPTQSAIRAICVDILTMKS
uniref:URB1 ribosome biogenesis homolog n=1 Tax=Mastacembelus armatus TaxID=205130 RepID=A0A7N8Y9U1_9TELE